MKIRGLIYTENHRFEEGCVYIDEQRISDVVTGNTYNADIELCEDDVDAKGLLVIPGLTDIHIHGCVGVDFCNASIEDIQKASEYELLNGITQMCPTTMSYDEGKLHEVVKTLSEYSSTNSGAEVVGINMEGPFISHEKKAAQNQEYIVSPDIEMFRRLQKAANNNIKLVDIAPEEEGALKFIKELTSNNEVRVSLAHTMATYEEAMAAFNAGATHVTHLFNAMRSFNHREPGVIGAVSDYENAYAELIGDGLHISPSVIRMAFKIIGDDRLVLISDSMEGTGLPDGEYSLGGQLVKKREGIATLSDGVTLAGAVTNLMDNMRNIVKNVGISLESVVRCATETPARAIGIYSDYGSIASGKIANMVILDKNLNVKYVVKNGRKIEI